jgi:hypothetical protein
MVRILMVWPLSAASVLVFGFMIFVEIVLLGGAWEGAKVLRRRKRTNRSESEKEGEPA